MSLSQSPFGVHKTDTPEGNMINFRPFLQQKEVGCVRSVDKSNKCRSFPPVDLITKGGHFAGGRGGGLMRTNRQSGILFVQRRRTIKSLKPDKLPGFAQRRGLWRRIQTRQ